MRPLEELSGEYEAFLTWFADPLPRDQADIGPEIERTIASLRERLYGLVFDYESAFEMTGWTLPSVGMPLCAQPTEKLRKLEKPREAETDDDLDSETLNLMGRLEELPGDNDICGVSLERWGTMTPKERESMEHIDPWHLFAESEFLQGSYWIRLLWEAWELWGAGARPTSVDDLGDSVFGKLIANIDREERRRFGGKESKPSLSERFLEARAAAWKVVAEETRKAMLGRQKLGRSDPKDWQRLSDMAFAQLSESFIEMPAILRNRLGKPKERLENLISQRELSGAAGIKTDPKGVRNCPQETGGNQISPTKELVAGLLWTSGHLPLCMMRSSAAANAVRQVMALGIGCHVLHEDQTAEAFIQSFRVMTVERGLKYFEKNLVHNSKRVEIITHFVVDDETASNSSLNAALREDIAETAEHTEHELGNLRILLGRVHKAQQQNNLILDTLTLEDEVAIIGEFPADGSVSSACAAALLNYEKKVKASWGEFSREIKPLLRLQYRMEGAISSLDIQTAPPSLSKFARLQISPNCRGTGIEQLRLRLLNLGNGLVSPEG